MTENHNEVCQKADEMFTKNEVKECYKYLSEQFDNGCTHSEVEWHLAKACYEMASALPPDQKKERNEYITRGLEHVNAALEKDSNIGEAHKWAGILLAEEEVGTKEKVANAYIIRDHFLKAIELCPSDSTAFFCMGKWCYSIMKISWLERTAAKLLFGAPPTSSYLDAFKYVEESVRLNETIQNTILLGDCLIGMGKTVESMIWFQKAEALPVISEKDKIDHDIAVDRIKNVNLIY